MSVPVPPVCQGAQWECVRGQTQGKQSHLGWVRGAATGTFHWLQHKYLSFIPAQPSLSLSVLTFLNVV